MILNFIIVALSILVIFSTCAIFYLRRNIRRLEKLHDLNITHATYNELLSKYNLFNLQNINDIDSDDKIKYLLDIKKNLDDSKISINESFKNLIELKNKGFYDY